MPQTKKAGVECPICGHKAGSKSALTAHAKKEHGSTELTDLANKYGLMAPRPGGAFRPGRPLKAAPSGVPSIDWAIGIGGVPRGTIIEIFGPAGCIAGDMLIDVNVIGDNQPTGRSRKVKLEDLYRRFTGQTPEPVQEGQCACGCGGAVKRGKRFLQHHASRMERVRGTVRVRSLINGEIRLQSVRNVVYSGIRPTVLVRTAAGRELRCTPDHRVLTPTQWLRADCLTEGEEIVCNGREVDSRGYPVLLGEEWENHPRARLCRVLGVDEHVAIAEEKLGRPLRDDEIVHHVDENPMNNDPRNLAVVSRSEHNSVHKLRHNFHGAVHPHNGAQMVVLPEVDTVVSVEPMSWCQTFDLQMDSEPNFVANGTIVHNCGKTLTALTFSAYSQQHGGRCAYVDAEHRLQPTFAMLVPNLDLDKLEYSEPDGGETALNETKDYVKTGAYDVWTVDSVHGCVPRALRDKEIGDATMAELAKLMSAACQVLEPIVAETNTVVIFVNHVKSVPGALYGRGWSKPGGSALDYYASVQLHVEPRDVYLNAQKRKIGHTVRVKVENSKVAAPYAVGRYNVFYTEDRIVKDKHELNGMEVTPGIDIWSAWFSVCEEAKLLVRDTAHRWVQVSSGEVLGYRKDVMQILRQNEGDLYQQAWDMVYGKYHSGTKAEAATA